MATTKKQSTGSGNGRPYKVIGTRPIRHDGTDKVTGRAKYGADIHLSGMLEGAILRSPHPHARINSIDTSRALAMPGVHAVVTQADMPEIGSKITDLGEGMFNLRDVGRNVLADDKVLYKGHAVAAVAAEDARARAERRGQVAFERLAMEIVGRGLGADLPGRFASCGTDLLGLAGRIDDGKPPC